MAQQSFNLEAVILLFKFLSIGVSELLAEFFDTAFSIKNLLFAGIEWVTVGANVYFAQFFGTFGLERRTARTFYYHIFVLWMYFFFHF